MFSKLYYIEFILVSGEDLVNKTNEDIKWVILCYVSYLVFSGQFQLLHQKICQTENDKDASNHPVVPHEVTFNLTDHTLCDDELPNSIESDCCYSIHVQLFLYNKINSHQTLFAQSNNGANMAQQMQTICPIMPMQTICPILTPFQDNHASYNPHLYCQSHHIN